MKYLFSIVLFATLAFASPAFAQTNTGASQTVLEQVKDAAKQTVATNINQVMVQILTGVKDASGEIYGASKVAVGQAYEFVKKEAPEVIVEFLRWRMIQAIIWALVFLSVAALLFFFARQLKLWAEKNPHAYRDNLEMAIAMKWVMRVIACLTIIITLMVNGMTVGKIVAAPRVYIIEYVVDTINGSQPSHR